MLSIKFGIHPCSQHHFKPPCPQTPSAPDSTEYNDFPLISVPNPPPYHPDLLTHQPFFGFVCVCVCVVWPPPPPPRPHPFPKFNQYFLTSALHIFPDLLPSQSIISIPHTSPSLIAFMHPKSIARPSPPAPTLVPIRLQPAQQRGSQLQPRMDTKAVHLKTHTRKIVNAQHSP